MTTNELTHKHWGRTGAGWVLLAGTEQTPNLFLQYVKDIELQGPQALTLDITAVSHYMVWVNGEYLGRGPAVGSPRRYYYHTYEIPAERLKAGANRIAVQLFHDGEGTKTVQGFRYGRPGLLAHLHGESVDAISDPSWRVRRAPEYSQVPSMASQWGGYKEFYHGEHADSWREPGFDVSGWETAVVVAPPRSKDFVQHLAPLDVPELETRWVAPVRIVETSNSLGQARVEDHEGGFPAKYAGQTFAFEPGETLAAPSVTLDFGAIWVGYPEIYAEGRDVIFEVWYGENLDLWRLDVVRLPEGGVWQAFHRRAYRFMKIVMIAMPEGARITSVRHCNAWYAYNHGTELALSDHGLDLMLRVSRHTLRANTSYHYEDCPMREQALWIMDMRIMALINGYLYGNQELTAKCLRQAFAIQREDGSIASTGPKDNEMFMHDFLLHLVATLKEHYLMTGDQALVQELYPNLQQLDAYIRSFRDDDGLLDADREPRGCPFLDWSEAIEKRGKSVILNSLYKCYLEDMADLSRWAGESEDAPAFTDASEQVRERLHALLYDPERRLYYDTVRDGEVIRNVSQQANMAAIYAGISPSEDAAAILDSVWDGEDYPRPFGPSYYLITVAALAKLGRYEAMLDVFRSYWGDMLRRGATTWWEVFDHTTPEWVHPHPFLGNVPTYEMDWIPISSCHGWSGIPGYAIPRYLLGIDLLKVHAGQIVVEPKLPGLFERAEYRVPIGSGWLHLRFRKDGERYEVEVLDRPHGIEVRA